MRWQVLILFSVNLVLAVPLTSANGSDLLYRQQGLDQFRESEANQVGVRIYPFWNTSLPWDERVDDLVSRLTLQELQLQLARGGAGELGGPAPAIPRLGIQAFQWASECLTGAVDEVENATAFPSPIGLAATFSPKLVHRVAAAIGKEVRGKKNDFVRRGTYATHTGDNCFSPVINIMRDPRWGRNQETYGEDPFLSGALAFNYIQGLQGDDKRFIQASSTCKHFDVHSGPEDIPVSRLSFNAQVSERDMHMTFLPAFHKCVEAGAYGVMCSYNKINGVPACANHKLLTDILRTNWGFKGFVISDGHAIEYIITEHRYFNTSVDTVAACVNAGCNIELSDIGVQPVYLSMLDAVKAGKLSEETIRKSAKPLFYTRMRLGEFDPPTSNPFSRLSNKDVETPEHRALAVEAASKSFVLLKNAGDFLPLGNRKFSSVGVLGPMANNSDQLFGDYQTHQDPSFTKNPLQALQEAFDSSLHYQVACRDGTPCREYNASAVREVVENSELVFLILGTGPNVEDEGRDRPDVELAGHQKSLLTDVLATVKKNTRIVLLLFNAGPLNITVADRSDLVPAIMECFLPGQATGEALVRVLMNKDGTSSPAGRLPSTWPLYKEQIPPMVNYSMSGRTYRYFEGTPLYPFGYGLSYSRFYYKGMSWNTNINARTNLSVSITVENIGLFDADEVVQCYISWADSSLPVPRLQLAFVERVHIKKGARQQVDGYLPWQTMAFWAGGQWVVQAGTMNLYCGGQQPGQTKHAPSNTLSGIFQILNTVWLDTL